MGNKLPAAALLCLTFVLAICLKNDFIRFLLGFEILMFLAAWAELWLRRDKYKAELFLPEPRKHKGENIPVRILLQNSWRHPTPDVKVTLVLRDLWSGKEVSALGKVILDGKEKGELVLSFRGEYLGVYGVRCESLLLRDFFGVFHRRIQPSGEERFFYILPELSQSSFLSWEGGEEESEGMKASFASGDSDVDTADIRLYREGDLLRQIHWKLSGKLDKLLVREIGEPLQQLNRIYLNLQREEETLSRENWESFLKLATETSCRLLNGGQSHYVYWIDIKGWQIREYCVKDMDSLNEMLCGLFYAKTWFRGEASEALEEIRFEKQMEENIQICLTGQIIFAGERR